MPLLPTIWSLLKRHRKKAIAGAILLILLGLGVSRTLQPKQSEYVTAIAERGNLQQTVEAVGTVISERDLELRFAATGIVQQVFVREGDNVIAGQKLARLKGSSLSANIASLSAALLVAQADLRALEEGTRPEDIAIAEADFQNKRASLQSARQTLASAEMNITQSEQQMETLRREAAVNLSGQVSTSLSGLGEDFTMIENSLSTVDDVLARTDVDDALVKSNPAAKSDMQSQKRTALSAIAAARAPASDTAANYQQALSVLGVAKSAAEQSGRVLDSLFSLISSLPETQYMSASVRETIKASIATERSGVQTATSSIASAHSALQNASASYDTKIASQSASVVTLQGMRDKAKVEILTYEAAVRSGEAQLQLQRAGARRTDIDAARARVRQAQANLARSQADYADTILTAPVSGTVTHVHIRIGESTPTGAAVTLLGESPYRVEMFVAEIDIPKVQLTQSGSIELDAFPDTHFALRVGDIDPSATDKEGVSKYRVRLDFVHPHPELKIGMTGDAEITTGMRTDIIHVPRRAVLESEEGGKFIRVFSDDGEIEERAVTIGMEGESGEMEVLSGVMEGETVVVLIKQ